MHRPQNRTAALLAAFGCALAYLPAGRALAAVCAALPLSAAGQSFALHCAAAPLAEELVFRGAVQGLLRPRHVQGDHGHAQLFCLGGQDVGRRIGENADHKIPPDFR